MKIKNLYSEIEASSEPVRTSNYVRYLGIFKYIYGISKKFIPNSSIDEEISLWGNRMVLLGVIYHEAEQSHCRHYTSGVNVNNTWFLISNTRILMQQKLQCNSRGTSVRYILIYIKKTIFW